MNATSAVRNFVDQPCGSFRSPASLMRQDYGGPEIGAVLLGDTSSDDMICDGIVGRSTALRTVIEELEMVAPTDSTVLICGETGTGRSCSLTRCTTEARVERILS